MTQERRFYEFGPFRIERGERLLRRGDQVVPLPPKALDLLVALVERGGEVVQKDELLGLVWPDTFVEEGSLAQNVSLLRRTLGESGADPYIATIPRRGYRFVAPVRTVREDRPGPRSLAVLPLANLSGDPSQNFFISGRGTSGTSGRGRISGARTATSGRRSTPTRRTHPPMRGWPTRTRC